MNDLISKQALIEDIQKSMEDNPHIDDKIKLNHHTEHFHFLTLVHKQPIAYDVDKVVEQLENRASLRDKMALSTTDVDERYNSYIKSADVYRQVTLIMKGAVKDE